MWSSVNADNRFHPTHDHIMAPRLIQTREDDIITITLDRVDKHNAVDDKMLHALLRTAHALKKDRHCRAVIIRANGQSFCSGLDFPSFTKTPHKIVRNFIKVGLQPTNLFQEVCMAWRALPFPVIAALHGRCYGAGMQLALAADFRMCTPECELSILEAKWGLIPDMSGTITLRELVGIDRAKLLTMTGRMFTGEEALQWGLVTELHDDPTLAAQNLAREIAFRSPDAVGAAKALFQQTWQLTSRQALAKERRIQVKVMLGKHFPETLKANAQKRKPRYGKRSWWI